MTLALHCRDKTSARCLLCHFAALPRRRRGKKKKERRRSPPDKVGAFASAGDAAADKRCFPPSVRCSPKPRAVMLSDSGGI